MKNKLHIACPNEARMNQYIYRILLPGFLGFFLLFTSGSTLVAQDDSDDPVEIFWGDDEDEYDDEDYEDEEYEEDYEDEEYDDEFEDEEYEEDEYFDEEDDAFYEEGDDEEIYDEEYEDEEFDGEGELEDVELADAAERQGYSLTIMGASPGFVNHQLNTYNSSVDFKAGLEFPALMQVGPLRFRLGAELGTFSFTNYKPVGGEFSGFLAMGILSFPAGPGQVKLGAGLVGNVFGLTAESSYGLTLGNAVEIRFGVRSTTGFGVKDSKGADLGTVSWMDGILILGVSI
ncbi:MAG: hypothetical protein HOD97_03220 [Candidatus Marinimicrobia bacterium]|jgi:hypothetical protein|nr:hypothetical protein [Candidatus Neomarinimicrobiota bacterium]MBT3618293.1 hypothetical protein [Candidatus Neomarinimicrobiota bacterium]MBT3828238.1 hypothetical protein [Candidatus Neomarinimicrobiota bacterium]MBT3997155.1 hypothetical protein [Candidatus Neomarinimicrobiota bacterium]MBT4280621.1 hypothetical protein [Candidatus Neomarinimicrobiota bacterium]